MATPEFFQLASKPAARERQHKQQQGNKAAATAAAAKAAAAKQKARKAAAAKAAAQGHRSSRRSTAGHHPAYPAGTYAHKQSRSERQQAAVNQEDSSEVEVSSGSGGSGSGSGSGSVSGEMVPLIVVHRIVRCESSAAFCRICASLTAWCRCGSCPCCPDRGCAGLAHPAGVFVWVFGGILLCVLLLPDLWLGGWRPLVPDPCGRLHGQHVHACTPDWVVQLLPQPLAMWKARRAANQ